MDVAQDKVMLSHFSWLPAYHIPPQGEFKSSLLLASP